MRDLFNRVKVSELFPPVAAVGDNTAQVSNIIDVLGYESLVLVLETGVEADVNAIFDITVHEGDDSALSDAAVVAAGQIQFDSTLTKPATGGTSGAQASFLFSDDSKSFKIGYIGYKRYVRVTVTPTGNSGNLFLAGSAVQSNALHQPAGATQLP